MSWTFCSPLNEDRFESFPLDVDAGSCRAVGQVPSVEDALSVILFRKSFFPRWLAISGIC